MLFLYLTGNSALNAFSSTTGGGRDFDSLSAALSGGGGFNAGGSSLDRNRNLGSNVTSGGGAGGVGVGTNRPSDSIIIKNVRFFFKFSNCFYWF